MTAAAAHPEFLSYRTKRLYLLISQRIDDELRPHGLGRSQWQILSRLARAGTLTQKDLQHALQVESATLTGIVDTLAAKGWLQRLESAEDKRVKVLEFTPAGRERVKAIPDPYELVETRMLADIPAEDRIHMRRVLEAMIANLEDRS
ncbi:MAG: MarR family transcriptional regulator [Actinomycetia bacterium]|nr:MarR family transcriptional regulator [Actinomycetes bacterium]